MVPRQRDFRLCLFLLLGLLGMVISFHGAPSNYTPAQWFEFQHINMSSNRCTIAMQAINFYYLPAKGNCKPKNTFLHTTFPAVAHVCTTPNVTCPTTHATNCHNSSIPVAVTNCDITRYSPSYMNCTYHPSSAQKIYIVACDCRTNKDNPRYTQVPVHLDWLI
ncbi:non-secretory ribonuclease-like [Hipposideros larvatus]